ncbi:MAG: hypothetical protein AB1540_12295, partial [Bdellovibrionota bacterium]
MLIRPWPIVILAACYFFAPLGNAILSAFLMEVGLGSYFKLLFEQKSLLELMAIFAIYPIAAYSIYSI